MKSVRQVTQREIPEGGALCLALAHNEAPRVEDFLRHHRKLGVVHFLILDDNSTDRTADMLRDQEDVTLFAPVESSYRTHKVAWRSEILDAHANGRWVLVPDLDELLIFPFCDRRSLASFTAHLDREGAEAVFTPMIDMYADAPLTRALYWPGDSMLAAFPYFDAEGYRLIPAKRKHSRQYPTPPLALYGGARERLFYNGDRRRGRPRWAVRRFGHLKRSMTPSFWERVGNRLARIAARKKIRHPPLLMSKIGLLKWRAGMRFSGGPHAVSTELPLSQSWGALLHFKFIDFAAQIAYKAERGQHCDEGAHYKLLQAKGEFHRSPFYDGSRRYNDWRDLRECGLIRCSRAWELEVELPRQLESLLAEDGPHPWWEGKNRTPAASSPYSSYL
jgi:Glycosyl transferase family 2